MLSRLFRIVLIYLAVAPQSGAAQEMFSPLGRPPPPPYVAPNRLFSVLLPPGWGTRVFADRPDFVELRMVDRPGTAWLQIQRTAVAEGAQARQLLVRAVEGRLQKLPHFVELQRRDINFNGRKGASVLGTYWYQGNAQYPRTVEEVYIVAGHDAYELHFECFEPLSAAMAGELNLIYGSFVPRPALEKPPVAPEESEDPLDKIPF